MGISLLFISKGDMLMTLVIIQLITVILNLVSVIVRLKRL